MNKTVNINLAGIFFHIDEEAYLKLQRYLDAIKESFTDTNGSDEIIADIEARIAELFAEKIKNERQVIGNTDVDDVIALMGQPEDYKIDEEIYEDEPINKTNSQAKSTRSKSLYRDTRDSYIGGVSSGIAHYLSVEPVWIRLSWILLTFFSSGAFILIYLAFWIFAPEAKTTSDFLDMEGEDVTVSSIEKKIKEGFDGVADTVKNADYSKIKSSSTNFFETLVGVVGVLFKIFIKLIGCFFIFIAGITLVSLFIAFFTVGIFGIVDSQILDYIGASSLPEMPLWILSLIVFFAVGIPFFFLLIVGLKILIKNLKSIATPIKIGLFSIWILSIVGLILIGIRQATLDSFDAEVISEQQVLPVTNKDTLYIRMESNSRYIKRLKRKSDFKIKRNEEGNKVIVMQDISLYLKPNKRDTTASFIIKKSAEGKSFDEAEERADELSYAYRIEDNTLLLDGYAITEYANKYRDQEINIDIMLPEGITIVCDDNTSSFNKSWKFDDCLSVNNQEGSFLKLADDKLICESCPKDQQNEEGKGWNSSSSGDNQDFKIKIDENGVLLNNEPVRVKINENGIEINSEN